VINAAFRFVASHSRNNDSVVEELDEVLVVSRLWWWWWCVLVSLAPVKLVKLVVVAVSPAVRRTALPKLATLVCRIPETGLLAEFDIREKDDNAFPCAEAADRKS
jgi:hypothetical protein